jgi:hypothetical protein
VAPRVVAASTAAWCALQALGRAVDFTCRWPLWSAALLAGVAVEAAAALYARERRVIPPRLGLALVILRAAAVAAVLLMLLQPVLTRTVNRRVERHVAVLLDDSASMHFVDRQWTAAERIGLGVHAGLCDESERLVPALARLAETRESWRTALRDVAATNQLPAPVLRVLREGATYLRDLQAQTDRAISGLPANVVPESRDALGRLQRQTRDAAAPALADVLKASLARQLAPSHVSRFNEAADQLLACGPPAREGADFAVWSGLGDDRRRSVLAFCQTSRWVLAESVLTRRGPTGEALLDRLADRYDVDLYRIGRSSLRIPADQVGLVAVESRAAGSNAAAASPVLRRNWRVLLASNDAPAAAVEAFRGLTDYAAALDAVVREIPSEQLAGVLLVSDGRHNSDASVDPIARRLALQDVPVCSVRVGGSRLPVDIALADVSAPESIFLGDRVRVHALLRATGAAGRKAKVRLLLGDCTVDQKEIDVSSPDWRQEVRLSHDPSAVSNAPPGVARALAAAAAGGALGYTLRVDPLPDELFADNNAWSFDVAVSEDRTNVLLVDDRPRWEFRYLRNLFFGRDKSVHLQYYLAHPDVIAGAAVKSALPPASAARKFGDAEAGALPRDRTEWRKFDVIILGDVGPDVVSAATLATIEECVSERGALLVVIAGPRAMPHAWPDPRLAAILPVRYAVTSGGSWTAPEEAYRLVLTPAGRTHAVLQQSASLSETEAIWAGLPEINWRFPLTDAKPGAEVLAYAVPAGDAAEDFADVTVEDAVARLDEETRKRSRNALIAAQNYGRGKVLMLAFDRTWRLRYRMGDTYHHRFWGQVIRWGVGEKLRAGGERLRLGTDRLTYAPGDAVQVFGRVLDERLEPIDGARLTATLRREGMEVCRVPLAFRAGSQGFYEGRVPAVGEPGRYTVELQREDVRQPEAVRALLLVSTAQRPIERAEVAATDETLASLARWTGGRVVPPEQAGSLWNVFGEGRRLIAEPRERPLWSNPAWFVLLIGLLAAEWLLRKRGGLT